MKSFKNWQLVNESFFPGMTLGLAHPQSLGLQSNLPGISLSEKKKMDGEVFVDDDGDGDEDDCSCKHKKGKGKKHHEPDGDEVKFSKKNMKKNMKKKMKKHMDDDVEELDHDDHDDDDVNDVETPDDHDDDDYDDDHDDDHDDHDHDDDDDDHEDHDDGDGDDDHHDDDGDDAPKFGFMKDKKKSKKQRKDEAAFWEDINANYGVPKNEIGTDKEFFDSLARQYGNPHVRYSGGVDRVDEDLLLSPEQQALIDAMPRPGEVGYAPSQRLGGSFAPSEEPDLQYLGYGESTDYEESVEESSDYEVLCKYFSEDVARELIEKRREVQ